MSLRPQRYALALLAGLICVITAGSLAAAGVSSHKFWVKCRVTIEERAIDPILAFGTESMHPHVFFGTRITRVTTGDSLRDRARTNCSAETDFSGYWVPTFYDARGALITPDDLLVYYRASDVTRPVVPFPQDLARVSEDVRYSCGRGTEVTSRFHVCPAPSSPRLIVKIAPEPGVDPNFPEVRLDVRWTSQVGADPSTWTASSDGMSVHHGDFLNGWTRRDLRRLIDGCLNALTPARFACGKVTGAES